MIWLILQFILGMLLLSKAADWFARGASRVALLTGFSRLVIGAALVGLVTNLPELLVSGAAAWASHGEIAFANPIGSNITNTALILGLCLVRMRAVVEPAWLRDQGIPMLLAGCLLYAGALWWDITRPLAVVLLLLCGFYMVWMVITARRDPVLGQQVEDQVEEKWGQTLTRREQAGAVGLLLAISIPLLFISSRWVLSVAVQIATRLEISEGVIGLTLIAAGTSLPELVTVMAASRRGHHDTSIGIILGSNVYNALGVVGFSGLISQLPVSSANRLYDLPVMLLVLALPLVPALFGRVPGRKTGLVLLSIYGVYTYSLFTLYGIFA